MPCKDPKSPIAIENHKKALAKYYIKTKKIKQQYYLDNIEKLKQYKKEYAIDNPKSKIICTWKFNGIIEDDWDGLYEYFITQTNCWICDKVYNNDKHYDRRCLDHDHDLLDEPNIRYICCGYCNIHIVG